MKAFIPYLLAALAISGVALAQQPSTPESSPSPLQQPLQHPLPADKPADKVESPKRLTINVRVTEPADLKVKEGDWVQVGQLIADRARERARLTAQQSQLRLTLTKLQTMTLTPPLPPVTAPAIAALPHATYAEFEAAIEKAKAGVEQAEAEVQFKKQELGYLAQLPSLNPMILEHERATLQQLQRTHTEKVRDYQLALGKFATAKNNRSYQEYQHRLNLAQRVEAQNQAALEYQNQIAAYEQRLRDREYQLSQTQLRLDEVNNGIESLAVVKSPYAGRVRRVKWLGQGPDGSLSAEVSLVMNGGDR